MRRLILLITHGITLVIGFALGVYFLPILTAPKGPDVAILQAKAQDSEFKGTFSRDRRGSDFLHWGEGEVSLSADEVVHMGRLAPGPDYMLYLTKSFVEDEAEFQALKDEAANIGAVKTFDGLALPIPEGVDIHDYTTVVIWCEAFSEFITSAKYR
jgi:hypothetical protein